jgi:thioredoxin-like negative regulator of GroEL
MAKRGRTRANNHARPIRTKRDREGAEAIVKTMSGQADRDSAAERRLQSLLRQLDQIDESEDFESADSPPDDEYLGPRRRWSDE